jgi:hypothetical protein
MSPKNPACVLLAVLVSLLAGSTGHAQTVWYVDDDAEGNNTGTSWQHAFTSLQSALDVAQSGHEIRVAQGTYKPDPTGLEEPRLATFQLVNGVAIRGGYAGVLAGDPDLRNVRLYETILTGDIGVEGSYADNCYHVAVGGATDESAVLDGFTITGGNADGAAYESNGAGVYVSGGSPSIMDCTFRANLASDGAGIAIWHSSSPAVENCRFVCNTASAWGGGLHIASDCHPEVSDCVFMHNCAQGGGGVGLLGSVMYPQFTNCIFERNSATLGGAVACIGGDPCPHLRNCTFFANVAADYGGAVGVRYGGSPMLVNCILWGNVDAHGTGQDSQLFVPEGESAEVDYSCIQGWDGTLGGTGNIGDYPSFVSGCYLAQVLAGQATDSPCVDTGDPSAELVAGTTRTDGVQDAVVVDMGYHFAGPACLGDVNGDELRNFSDFTQFSLAFKASWQDPHFEPHADLDGDGLVNVTDFTIFSQGFGLPCP